MQNNKITSTNNNDNNFVWYNQFKVFKLYLINKIHNVQNNDILSLLWKLCQLSDVGSQREDAALPEQQINLKLLL